MLYWSYWATILAKNMTIPNQFYLPSEVTEALRVSGSNEVAKEIVAKYVLEQKLPIKNRMHDQAYRYCSHCTMVKPDRAHHCSICKTCNLKFDHHCPWINNCVMYSNYKQFLLFLGYGFTLCVFVAITNIDALVTFFNTTQNGSTSLSISKSFHLIFLEFISGYTICGV
uniref:Palmitoyltransferase n=1 Tax=Rhabditophanes sp. KR3021 TaxID=114890 RepID=A0AC35TSS2_9BILA